MSKPHMSTIELAVQRRALDATGRGLRPWPEALGVTSMTLDPARAAIGPHGETAANDA